MAEEKPSGSEVGSGDRMTDTEFASARERYELGTAGLVDLADEYGVTRQALSKRFKNNGVVKGSRAHEVASATEAAAKKAAAEAAAASERFAIKRSDWIEEVRIQGLQALKQARLIAQKTVVDEMKRPVGGDLANIDTAMRAISRYNKVLIDNIEGSLRILKSDEHVDEDDLPNLVIEDLTNEEILHHHKMTGAIHEDATVDEMLAEDLDDIEDID